MKKVNGVGSAIASFFRRNLTYLILLLCIVAVGVSIALILVGENQPIKETPASTETPIDTTTPYEEEKPIEEEPETPTPVVVSFCLPVESYTSVHYYTDTVAFNSSLNRYSSHKAIDFLGEEGTKVFCAFDGVISNIENSLLSGVTVTVSHGDGLYTVYNSLLDLDGLEVGKTLSKGELLGVMSTSNRQEYKDGAHLHFETIENGVNINPEKYLTLGGK